MSKQSREDILRKQVEREECLVEGHYVLSAKKKRGSELVYRHSQYYINKQAIATHTPLLYELCSELAIKFVQRNKPVDVVVAPERGGSNIGSIFTLCLNTEYRPHTGYRSDYPKVVRFVEAEKDVLQEGAFRFAKSTTDYVSGKRVVILDDVFNTGASVRSTVDAVRKAGGRVLAAVALFNRGIVRPNCIVDWEDVGYIDDVVSLLDYRLPSYDAGEETCPLCKAGIPINTDLGRGEEYLQTLKEA